MIERELAALADRVAPEPPANLPERVLARLEEPTPRERRPRLVAGAAAALAALAASSLLVPQVRAVAADLLGVAGIEISSDEPDAPPEPEAPLPDSRDTPLAQARAQVAFPIGVPGRLGRPDEVVVADHGRVVSMTWEDDSVLLDQFDGTLGPVFAKQVGATGSDVVRVHGARAFWLGGAHDLTYVDRHGDEVRTTARRAGRSLVWESGGVTFRLEGDGLRRSDAAAIARSVR